MFAIGKELIIVLLLAISILLNVIFMMRRPKKEQKPAEEEIQPPKAELTDPGECYEKFFPEEILKLLHKKTYTEISVGDQRFGSSVMMEINTVGFREFARDKQPDVIFTYINRMMSRFLPIIYENNGIVESFTEGGMTVFFQENREGAMVAAISVCEAIGGLSLQNQEYQAVTVGICYGPMMIGVVGHEKRMTVLVLSESQQFSKFLQSIGSRYYAKIIATGDFLEEIPDYKKKFNCRLLGYVYLKGSNTVEKIYDVFDGDVVEVRNKKRKTKMVFEKGVSLYIEGQIGEARQHFIEVMKMDRDDQAAKEYLLRCDKRLNGEMNENPFIEQY